MGTEFVSLVNSEGKVQLKSIPRHEAENYPNLYLQIVVAIILNKAGHVLVERRATSLEVNPGCIDTVCGAIATGETPLITARRESVEETGVNPKNLKVVAKGVNQYNRFRFLVVGSSDEKPIQTDPAEVEWAKFIPIEELRQKKASGEYKFVADFFDDLDLALKIQLLAQNF